MMLKCPYISTRKTDQKCYYAKIITMNFRKGYTEVPEIVIFVVNYDCNTYAHMWDRIMELLSFAAPTKDWLEIQIYYATIS